MIRQFNYQIPGGMISNLAAQLAAQNASHLMGQVLEEVPRVRRELGYPPLVTLQPDCGNSGSNEYSYR